MCIGVFGAYMGVSVSKCVLVCGFFEDEVNES